MEMRTLKKPLIVAFVTMLFLLVCSIALATSSRESGLLKATFLDVGQGDAIFIESPDGTQVLIDGGKGGDVLRVLQKEMGYFDRDINMILATHQDADHIGGLVHVLERYHVDTIVMTENVNDTPVHEAFMRAARSEGARILYARRGQTYDLGSGAHGSTTLAILFPDHDPTKLESNTASIVARLVYGESEYVLTGDSPSHIETYLVGIDSSRLKSDVLKVGHHGSRTSTAGAFVATVDPDVAVISAGKDNSYGHPHKEVLEILESHGALIKNTADLGNIRSFSNGETIWFK